jgi:hypothetical protein
MKKMMAAALVAATMTVSAPAMAATTITLTETSPGALFGGFTLVTSSPNSGFTDYQFDVPSQGIVTASATATFSVAANSGIKLTSIVLNGFEALASLNTAGNAYEARLDNVASITNPQTLRVNYTSTSSGSAAGTVSFTAAAVPEPATWALMILGFGVVGYAMRRRPAVRFAQAI